MQFAIRRIAFPRVSDLLSKIDRNIFSRELLRAEASVLVAVSGGVDSMVLLHVLHQLAGQHSWKLAVAHLNHQLRGRSSDADERLVIRTARNLGLPVVTEKADIRKLAKTKKISIEMAAREVRHEFLARTAKSLKYSTVALAHQADDQLELFFLRLLRGSGNEGLAGMKWRGASPGDLKIQLIRPLLNLPKVEVLAFARENKIPFREDATNALTDFQRNKIRHELLPLLRTQYQPALDRVISRVIDLAASAADFLNQEAIRWLDRPNSSLPFRGLHPALQRQCLQLQLRELGIAVDFELIEALRTQSGSPVSVAPNLCVVRDAQGRLQVRRTVVPIDREHDSLVADLGSQSGTVHFDNREINWRITEKRARTSLKAIPGRETFDADKVGKQIILRHWQPGDRFQPSGMVQDVKLQDLFTNLKIPRAQRHQLLVATTEAGELFWVEKLRISERFKVSAQTIRRLIWRWKPR